MRSTPRIPKGATITDETEDIRRQMLTEINAVPGSREYLEAKHGQGLEHVRQLSEDFDVIGFAAPLVVVCRKSDRQKGSLMFQASPRFCFALSRTARDTNGETGGKGRLPAISQNSQSPKSSASQDAPGATIMPENLPNGGSQNGKAKSSKAKLVARIARLVRQEGLDYEAWRYVQRRSARSVTCDPRRRGVVCPVS